MKSPATTASEQLAVWRARLLQAVLPNRCALCGNLSQRSVCGACNTAGRDQAGLRCVCCAVSLSCTAPPLSRCGACLVAAPAFDATLVFASYAPPFDALVQALKFSAQPGLARWFAEQLAACAQAAQLTPDLLIPVPLSAARLARRGYNQSWEIAKPLARRLATATGNRYLLRLRDTAAQTDLGDARQRRHNVRGAFAVCSSDPSGLARLRGAHVAVVDDVMTSGATLAEIARVLKRAGAARVTNLVALRTPAPSAAPGMPEVYLHSLAQPSSN